MKSIILLALLALCHVSLANPAGWKPCGCNGKPVLDVSDSSAADDSSDSADHSGAVVTNDSSDESISRSDRPHGFPHSHNCKHFQDKSKPKITYGEEQIVKGKPETYIHHQPKIVLRQPPTHVRIDHPPTVISPSTIVFRRHGKTIRKPVIYQHLPRDVQVRPVYVKVVKPIEKKVIVEKKGKPNHKLEYETKIKGETYSGSFDEHVKSEPWSKSSEEDSKSSSEDCQGKPSKGHGQGSNSAESSEEIQGQGSNSEDSSEESQGKPWYGHGSWSNSGDSWEGKHGSQSSEESSEESQGGWSKGKHGSQSSESSEESNESKPSHSPVHAPFEHVAPVHFKEVKGCGCK